MWKVLHSILVKERSAQIAAILFFLLSCWWISLSPFSPTAENEYARFLWGASYQIIAILGGLCGINFSKLWGGMRSVMGRAILCFSFSLLLQAFGQSTYSYYNLFAHIEAPYPSIGDIGFFGSIPFYIYGVLLLAKASGIRVSLRAFKNQLQAAFIPLLLLLGSYFIFLKNYNFDWSKPLTIFLDFGYPLGQAIYVSFAILTFLLSRKVLGGIMRGPIFFLLISLTTQYFCDFNFLFQFSQGQWFVGGYGDYFYLISYLLMTLALIRLKATFHEISYLS